MQGRDYQLQIISEVKEHMRKGEKKILIQLPTGGGKTFIASDMIRAATEKGKRCWFIANRVELIDQTANALYKVGVPFGIIAAGYQPDRRKLAQICSIQTLSRRMNSQLDKPDLLFWDETRGIAAKTWSNVYHNFPDAYHVGLDATPERASGEPLKKYYNVMVQGPTVEWLMEKNYLCKYRYFSQKMADFTDVRVARGDYVISDLDALMNTPKIIGNAIAEYKKYAMGKRNLVFCNSIAHSMHMCEEYNKAGIKAEHIDGNTDKNLRNAALKRFERGETLVLTSVDLVTAGLDIPAIQCVTLERKTKSVALWKQMIGRGLRTHELKDKLLIFDHVGGNRDHGFPDDPYPWTLEGRKKGEEVKVLSNKVCDQCYASFKPFVKICPECGYATPVAHREMDFEGTNDELVELDLVAIKRQKLTEQGMCKTEDELVELGKRRGMKNPRGWAKYIIQARQKKKLERGFR